MKCRNIIYSQKGVIILRTTHTRVSQQGLLSGGALRGYREMSRSGFSALKTGGEDLEALHGFLFGIILGSCSKISQQDD